MSVLVPVPAEWNQCNSAKRGRSELSDRVLDKEKKTPSPSPSPKRARGGHRTESEHQKFGEITQSRWVTPSTEFWRKRSNPPKYPPTFCTSHSTKGKATDCTSLSSRDSTSADTGFSFGCAVGDLSMQSSARSIPVRKNTYPSNAFTFCN